MQQGSILSFLKPKSSRPENPRPGQPYHPRPNASSSKHNSKHSSTGQHRGPNRRRNTDLKQVADETKDELPKILSSISSFNAAESSIHNLKGLDVLDPDDCPGIVLPYGDHNAGQSGTRIKVFDMDTFDAALRLNQNYKVYTHLGMPNPTVANTPNSHKPVDDGLMDRKSENDHAVKSDLDMSSGDIGQEEASPGVEVTKGHEDGDTIMKDDTTFKPEDNTHTKPENHKDTSKTPPKPSDQQDATLPFTGPTRPVAVLNLASERSPGGGWQNGALAQEECLCYRSSLYLSLHKSYYPLPSQSAIYTPSVLLIRDAMSRGHALLTPAEQPANLPVTSVISIAALRKPHLTDDRRHFKNEGQRAETKRKIRVTLRVAAHKGHTKLVLGALGCGVFANPPKEVAVCFLEVLREKEFRGGWWEEVAFAVLDNVKGPHGGKDGNGNYGVFYRVLDGQVV